MEATWTAFTESAPFSYAMIPCALLLNALAFAAGVVMFVTKRRKTVVLLGWLLGTGVAGLGALFVIGSMSIDSGADEVIRLVEDPVMREALERTHGRSLETLAWLCSCGSALPALTVFGLFLRSSRATEEPSD